MKFRILGLALTIAMLFAVNATAKDAKENKNLNMVYVEWDCANASSHLAKAVLEDKLGYKVELLPVTLPILWTSLATGDADAMVTAWLPSSHKDMYNKHKDDVEVLGKLTDGARLGLAVPDYVPLRSVEELKANADKFKGQIIGIDPGAGIMVLTEKLMKDYGLDNMELMEGSDAIMTSSLAEAIRNKEWVVITAWSPHWLFGRWNMHYLEDPKGSLGGEEGIYNVGRKDLKKDHPDAHAFLTKFAYANPNQLQQLMAWNKEKGADPMKNARKFMQEHPELVEAWLKK
ncbi:MAG: glycine betaine ABC transporter substrate-binding protein [Desulfovibrio sp.]|nr:glycine betaine ABC transporter substrate-binding protein [Desulfovibrio sp.]